jgi:hypothetical protein
MARFNHLHEIADNMDDRAHTFLDAYQGYWLNAAQLLAPVDVGDLRDSGELAPGDGEYERKVVFTVDYAVHQEFGTMFMPPQPYLRPARDALRGAFGRDGKRLFGEGFGR